ncbi:MAG: hypothetical protein DLM69_00225 [Candidatus Chloroheliales bacterium]|nr:MAG: hypothetical protein DLM69_00225 [Chloroflexota bacterium]
MQQLHYSEGQRSAILEAHITNYLVQGYQLVGRTPTNAQLIKVKKLNWLIIILTLIFTAGIGTVIYLIFYALQKGGAVSLHVDMAGIVHRS